MSDPLRHPLPGAADEALDAAEHDLGVALPAAYRDLLRRTNGGVLRTPRIALPGGGVVFAEVLFGADVGEPELPLPLLSEELREIVLDEQMDEEDADALRDRLEAGEDLGDALVPVPLDLAVHHQRHRWEERLPPELLAIGAEYLDRDLLCLAVDGPDLGAVVAVAFDDPDDPAQGRTVTPVAADVDGLLALVDAGA